MMEERCSNFTLSDALKECATFTLGDGTDQRLLDLLHTNDTDVDPRSASYSEFGWLSYIPAGIFIGLLIAAITAYGVNKFCRNSHPDTTEPESHSMGGAAPEEVIPLGDLTKQNQDDPS